LNKPRASDDGPSDLKAVDIVNHTSSIVAYSRRTTTVIVAISVRSTWWGRVAFTRILEEACREGIEYTPPADRGPQGRANRPVEGAPALHLAWSKKPLGCHGLQEPPEELSGTLPAAPPSEERWGRTFAGAIKPYHRLIRAMRIAPEGLREASWVVLRGSRLQTPKRHGKSDVGVGHRRPMGRRGEAHLRGSHDRSDCRAPPPG
jgi:hypothetical protein